MDNYSPISIIIPVYNTESYLRQCLDSAVCQTYEHLDIIIIDDGSTDGSSKICDEYASNPRIRVYHTPNHGISAARNFGLDHLDAQCKYVAFLDSDDWMESDCIQRMYNAVIRNDTDLAVCQFLNDYENQSIGASQIKEEKIVENKQILNELLVSNSIHNVVWNKLYSSDLFNNIRFPVGRTYEDVATTYKVLENVKHAAIVPENLIHYRIRNGSLSHNNSLTKLKDSWIAYYERYCYLYDKLSDPISKAKLIISCLSPINNMWRWYAQLPEHDKNEAKKTVVQMKSFLNTHRKDIMKSVVATKMHKLICIMTRFSNPVYMHLLYFANITLKAVVKRKKAY